MGGGGEEKGMKKHKNKIKESVSISESGEGLQSYR